MDDGAGEREAVRHPRRRRCRWPPTAPTATITGELVDVGAGTRQDFDGRDVKGKIVDRLRRRRADLRRKPRSAAPSAPIGYNALYADRQPDEIPDQSSILAGRRTASAGPVSPRVPAGSLVGRARARQRTSRFGRSIKSRDVSRRARKSCTRPSPAIRRQTQDVIVSSHLYEGYLKQGANDDNSGCALTLEVGRAYIKLIAEGKLPKPKRTINFQWVPEISGTNAWLNAHPDKAKRDHRRSELRHGRHPPVAAAAATGSCSARPTRSRRTSTTSARA